VRQAETLVKQWIEQPPALPEIPKIPANPQLAAHIHHLEDRFRSSLGTKVNLNRNEDGSGRLVVHFYSDDDLDAILRLVAGADATAE
jgi:ParB family chromosome partitioning protein